MNSLCEHAEADRAPRDEKTVVLEVKVDLQKKRLASPLEDKIDLKSEGLQVFCVGLF